MDKSDAELFVELTALRKAIVDAKLAIKRLKLVILTLVAAIVACVFVLLLANKNKNDATGPSVILSPSGSPNASSMPGASSTPDAVLISAITPSSGLSVGITILIVVLSILLLVVSIVYVRTVRLHDRLFQAFRGENERLAREIRIVQERVRRAEDNSAAIKIAMQRAQKELAANRRDLEEKNNRIKSTNQFLADAAKERDALRESLKNTLEEQREIKSKLADALGSIEPLKAIVAAKTEKIKTLESEVEEVIRSRGSRVASAVKEADEHIARLSEQLRDAKRTEAEKEKKIGAANKKLLENEKKLENLEEENQRLLEQKTKLGEVTATQQKKIDFNTARIKNLQIQVRFQRLAVDKATANKQDVESKVVELENAVEDAKRALNASQSKASELESRLREFGAQLAKSDDKVRNLSATVGTLKHKKDTLERAIESRVEELARSEKYAKSLEDTVKALRRQAAAAKERAVESEEAQMAKRGRDSDGGSDVGGAKRLRFGVLN